jgi:hypothetical protein
MPPDGPQPRFFSLEEANRMLPLVRRIVEDIMEQYRGLEPVVARFNALAPGEAVTPAGRRVKAEAEARTSAIDALVHELHELGCAFKGFDEGLVDWYSLYAGRPVFLCWRLGEPEIAWWHQVDTGFLGRQPIPPSQREAFRGGPPGGDGA